MLKFMVRLILLLWAVTISHAEAEPNPFVKGMEERCVREVEILQKNGDAPIRLAPHVQIERRHLEGWCQYYSYVPRCVAEGLKALSVNPRFEVDEFVLKWCDDRFKAK